MSAGNLITTVIGSFEKFLIKLAITKEQLFSNAKRSNAIKKKDILEGCLMVAHNELYLRSEGFRTRPPVADD